MNKNLSVHQEVMLEMLGELNRICVKYSISYMLFAGTMLGAVRHSGFIPWDDDLDVVMMRKEYERFLKIAPTELNESVYYLQKEFSPHWPMFFSKLRKNGTACVERYIPNDFQEHRGIYIDIFPCDNLSNKNIARKLQFIASKAVIARSLGKRGYLTSNACKKLFVFICKALPYKLLSKFVRLESEISTKNVHVFFGGGSSYEKSVFPRAWFDNIISARFENGFYPIPSNYDKILTKMYGNYMIPAPVEQRSCKRHCEIVDAERSYTEYVDVYREITFKEYTRSIR